MAHPRRAGALGKFRRFAEKSRDSPKILRSRPRIRGVAYFYPARHVGAVFAEFRQTPRIPSKWRKPAAPWLLIQAEERHRPQLLRQEIDIVIFPDFPGESQIPNATKHRLAEMEVSPGDYGFREIPIGQIN